ncbi:hypothetical protein SAMN05880561_101811 [Rhizobium sp. RU33A]|uniref:hypothetical protein n=1 Tax=Rhizobium sp. RU33A TaxID=1907413 RepID=UPI000953D8F9|nr:hypothetical protein [Rhizobium sp. RU33A]SIQ02149.1 hypothetical protein SAMN05880561_101811 [Rhizobium sp. RU33A]
MHRYQQLLQSRGGLFHHYERVHHDRSHKKWFNSTKWFGFEETSVDSISSGLVLHGSGEWTQVLVKEKASNFVTTLLTSFTCDKV